jgi:hypothetical protein
MVFDKLPQIFRRGGLCFALNIFVILEGYFRCERMVRMADHRDASASDVLVVDRRFVGIPHDGL